MNNYTFSSPFALENAITDNHFTVPKHLAYIEKIILDTISSGNGRLIINMPPRHGKSELASVWLPAWLLMENPDWRIVLSSYGSDLSNSFSRRVKEIIREAAPKFYGMKLDSGNKSLSEFSLDGSSGCLKSVGVDGPITGRGADLIIVDDPVKNALEANSPAQRENLYEWFRSTLFTRLEPGGSIIIVMTRWNNEDLTGKLLANDRNDNWKQIVIPAIAESGCPLGRKPGEALWPERYGCEALEEIRAGVGSYWFESQYNQKPQNPDGGIFKKEYFKFYRINGENFIFEDRSGKTCEVKTNELRKYITCDLAVRNTADSDFTVMAVFGSDSAGNIFVLDILRTKCSTLRHIELLKELNSRWNPDIIGIESVQYQYSLVETALEAGLPVRGLKPNGDKSTRFILAAVKAEGGKLFFPAVASWFDDVRAELLAFPNSAHDDVVDCFSYMTEIVPRAVSSIFPVGRVLKNQ